MICPARRISGYRLMPVSAWVSLIFFAGSTPPRAYAAEPVVITAENAYLLKRFNQASSLVCYDTPGGAPAAGAIAPFPIQFGVSKFRAWNKRKISRFEAELFDPPNPEKLKAKKRSNPLYKKITHRRFERFIEKCEDFRAPVPTATPTPSVTATPTQTFTPTATPTPPITSNVPRIALQSFMTGFSSPIFMTHANDQSGRLFVVQQGGQIRIIKNGAINATAFLDINTIIDSGGEEGLLGVAFHPNYATNGRFFVNYTDLNSDVAIAEYRVSAGNADLADPNSARVILTIPHPGQTNHNGGLVKFGPDGYLYISLGDGGGGGDPDGNGQDLGARLGKLLRIDVNGALPYAVPPDNPFVGTAGAQPEIWAYGLRNPWRFSFDRTDGRLFLADVGQGAIEEVDLIEKGDNLGWNTMEGTACYNPPANCVTGGLKLPIAEYTHADGQSITGGYLYRGNSFPEFYGKYIFGDFITRRMWVLIPEANGTWRREFVLRPNNTSIASFGEDQDGNLYVVAYQGTIYRIVEAP